MMLSKDRAKPFVTDRQTQTQIQTQIQTPTTDRGQKTQGKKHGQFKSGLARV